MVESWRTGPRIVVPLLTLWASFLTASVAEEPFTAKDLWDPVGAWRQTSPTREATSINGLWQFAPVLNGEANEPPARTDAWGWFKVPGIWPRGRSQAAVQRVLARDGKVARHEPAFDQAWYRREIRVPGEWAGRRVFLDFTMLQTHARVFLDGKPAGQVRFPGGRLEITEHAKPGEQQTLTILATARPLEELATSYSAPERVERTSARIALRGITGDMYLLCEPKQDALGDVQVITSTRAGTITLNCGLKRLATGRRRLSAVVRDDKRPVREFESEPFDGTALQGERFAFSSAWRDAKLWDIDTPGNTYTVTVRLHGADGQVLDESLPVRFGFREFWIDGRDFYLNGKRIHLRALVSGNINGAADRACLEGCRHTCRVMKEYGFNAAITNAYDFAPGVVGYLDAFLDAADETGLLVAYTLPHIKDFESNLEKPSNRAHYAALTEWLIRRAQNHASIVFYSMNHNVNGYYGDQNPLKIDGKYDPVATGAIQRGGLNRRKQSLAAAGIAESIDPTRVVYNHESGNMGPIHCTNTYLNWAPIQERCDWLEHWATVGVKPLFFVEYGLPHISSWSSFRGPQFIWRNPAFQCIWDSEFAAPYVGQRAYEMTPLKVRSLSHEEDLWARGKPFAWGQAIQHLRKQEQNYLEIQALFAADIWRSLRVWGISAMLPWDQEGLWQPIGPLTTIERKTRYQDLQRPGIVPDMIQAAPEMIYHWKVEEIAPTSVGRFFLRWNQPLVAYIGDGDRFTTKRHNYGPGETVRKQLVVLNDSRQRVQCRHSWTLEGGSMGSQGQVTVEPGDKAFVPVALQIPEALVGERGGRRQYALAARFEFDDGKVQEDRFVLDIIPRAAPDRSAARIAMFDPKGVTAGLFRRLGIEFTEVDAGTSLHGYTMLIIGREAISPSGALPDVSSVTEGLKVLVFEQPHEALAERLGFRTNVHGIRQVFVRVNSHPALQGIGETNLHDWRGAATLTPPYLDVPEGETRDPTWRWCGFENTRVWRCGNHGNVASVLIEKPPVGDFLPILDCGFDLQYSPLLECVVGKGRILFCQLDVSGRTEDDPAAAAICRNLVKYLEAARAVSPRQVVYAGGPQGEDVLKQLRLGYVRRGSEPLGDNVLVVAGPGAEVPDLAAAVARGAHLLCLGLSQGDLEKLLPGRISVATRQTVASLIEDFGDAQFAGLFNAELHWRTTRLSLAALEPHHPVSNEALARFTIGKGTVVLCQAAPWMFDYVKQPYLRTTYRRNLFLVSRLLSNLGAERPSPLLGLFRDVPAGASRWLHSYYVQKPDAVDDPYRYYRW